MSGGTCQLVKEAILNATDGHESKHCVFQRGRSRNVWLAGESGGGREGE